MSLYSIQEIAPFLVILFLFGFFIYFIAHYIRPSYKLEEALKNINSGLSSLTTTAFNERKKRVGELFRDTLLEHIWGEFQQTLHDQFTEKEGQLELQNSRGTVPAGYFFTAASVADRTLKTEYFKHLPGILTGIGIIGTFAGLLVGLSAFDASNTEKINESINLLLSGVKEAFIASTAAILAAMVVTHWEKLRYRKCLNELDTLNESIDALFDAGVGEEYLSQLVKSAEENSKQTRLLKDSLVTDLKEMLLNLVEANAKESAELKVALIESNRESSQKIADQIGESIASSLKDPLNRLAETVMTSAGDQSGKVQNLLQDALVAFMDRLDHTFGQQFAGLSDMLKSSTSVIGQMESQISLLIAAMQRSADETSKAASDRLVQMMSDMEERNSQFGKQVQEMLSAFNETISNMGSAGKTANDEMSFMMRKMFEDAAQQQVAMKTSLDAFIDSLTNKVGQGHQQTVDKISEALGGLSTQLGGVFEMFKASQAALQAEREQEQHNIQSQSQSFLEQLSKSLESIDSAVSSIGESGRLAGEGMATQVQTLLKEAETRQVEMSKQLSMIAGSVETQVSEGQKRVFNELETSLSGLGDQFAKVLSTFSEAQAELQAQARREIEKMEQKAKMALEQMDAQITSLLAAIREQSAGSKDVLEKLQQGTSTMVSGLINGAEKIGGAASRFELAGNAVSISTDKSANLISLVNRTTEHLGGASDRLAALIDDYESTKELVQKVISGAEKVSLTLESDASSREKMTQDLASVAEKLGSVTTEMKTYLRDFNGVVTTSFGSFTDGMNGSLSKVMSSLDNELDRAVKALGSGVSELAEVVEELSEVRVK